MGKVLIIGPLLQHTGNQTTAERIRSHILSSGRLCVTADINSFTGSAEFINFIESQCIQCVLAIHAIKSSSLLQVCPVPYCILFAGTDVSGHSQTIVDSITLSNIIHKARSLISFTDTMIDSAVRMWPSLDRDRVFCIPQAVNISITRQVIKCQPCWRSELGLSLDATVILLVAGIRPVKDPLFLVRAFSEWHQNSRPDVELVIIGPELDKEFCKEFHRLIDSLPGVVYAGALPYQKTQSIMAGSFALINTSLSEGMCTAILEGMNLEVPVVARNIPANAHLIEDGRSGFLCSTPQDFIEKFELLLEDRVLREKIVEAAKDRIIKRHSWADERLKYIKIINSLALPVSTP